MFKYEMGVEAKDKISGFRGIITGRLQFLNGCVRYQISPKKLDAGKIIECQWIDEQQIEVLSEKNEFKQKPVGGPSPAPRMTGMSAPRN